MSVCVSVTSDFIQSHFLLANVGRARHGMWQIGVVLVPAGPVDSGHRANPDMGHGKFMRRQQPVRSICMAGINSIWCGAILKVYSKQRRTRGHVETRGHVIWVEITL